MNGLVILEENHYYPFGVKHDKYNSDKYEHVSSETAEYVTGIPLVQTDRLDYRYKFNGQEFQDELGLNMTAMDYRQYDNALGRFNGMDVLAEIQYSQTSYHFSGNNPVFFSDPTGLIQGGAMINAMWNRTASGTNSFWQNDGAGLFYSASSTSKTGMVGIDGFGTFYENLMQPVTLFSGSANGGKIIQNHVYKYSHIIKTFLELMYLYGISLQGRTIWGQFM